MANDVTAPKKNRLKQRQSKASLYILVGPAADIPPGKPVKIEQNGVPKAVWNGSVVDTVPRGGGRVAAVAKVVYAADGPEQKDDKVKEGEDKGVRTIKCSITIDTKLVNNDATVDLYGDGDGD